jgi:hypothetical protein
VLVQELDAATWIATRSSHIARFVSSQSPS